jgi:hypothetical protein
MAESKRVVATCRTAIYGLYHHGLYVLRRHELGGCTWCQFQHVCKMARLAFTGARSTYDLTYARDCGLTTRRNELMTSATILLAHPSCSEWWKTRHDRAEGCIAHFDQAHPAVRSGSRRTGVQQRAMPLRGRGDWRRRGWGSSPAAVAPTSSLASRGIARRPMQGNRCAVGKAEVEG